MHFRNWASTIISEYMKKGFAMDDEPLKNLKEFGADYFDELRERIRDIRASEKRVYVKVKDIFATSIDYNPKSDQAELLYKTVQRFSLPCFETEQTCIANGQSKNRQVR